jgi:hypothetical protein
MNRDKAGEETDCPGERNEPPIMLVCKAIENPEHEAPPPPAGDV